MFKAIVLTLVAALCVALPAGAVTSWDLAADSLAAVSAASPAIPAVHGQWSHGQAFNLDAGWEFNLVDRGDYGPGDGLARWGMLASLDGDPNMNECPLQLVNTNATGPTYGLFDAGAFYVHGGVSATSTYADPLNHAAYNVMRWTAPEAGFYNVSALISGAAGNPNLVNCQVFVNGVSAFNQDFSWGDDPLAFASTFEVTAGSTIDLTIGPGAETGAWTCVSEQITLVPEPGSLLALGSGLLGLAGFVTRRRRA